MQKGGIRPKQSKKNAGKKEKNNRLGEGWPQRSRKKSKPNSGGKELEQLIGSALKISKGLCDKNKFHKLTLASELPIPHFIY